MKVGVCLPQFRSDAESSVAAARHAEGLGLDGVFVYDHLWPIGQPGRPSLHGMSLLAAVAAETSSLHVGTLVARTSLLPNAMLVHQFRTVHLIAGERLIAGIGSGDRLSEAENLAYGVPFAPTAERVAETEDCARRLVDAGITTWVGGTSSMIKAVTRRTGVPRNLWGELDPVAVARDAAEAATAGHELTWGATVDLVADGEEVPPPRPYVLTTTPAGLASHLALLRDTGVTWAVCAPPYTRGDDLRALDLVAEAASLSTAAN